MNYKIIQDEEELDKFVNWLPCSENDSLYISLIARKKYFTPISSNNQQLRRFVTQKKFLKQRVRQLECPLGSYKYGDLDIPNEALALYININPRSLWKGSCDALKGLADIIARGDKTVDPIKFVTNCVQQNHENKNFVIFDIDEKNPELIERAFGIVGKQTYIETRGGYHLLVDPKTISQSVENWYGQLKAFSDVSGDTLSSIPGTTQGGFCPKLIL
jgi:hypothetical protein